jgi:hypothetical protein
MASRLAIGTVQGVAGPRPRSAAGGGEASPAPVNGAMEGRDPGDVFLTERLHELVSGRFIPHDACGRPL